jgi:hypothetical protein
MRRQLRLALALAVVFLAGAACAAGPIPASGPTPTPCARNCPPPALSNSGGHVVSRNHFTLTYFDPWSIQDSSSSSVTLGAQSDFGAITVIVRSVAVANGTTSASLLSSYVRQNLSQDSLSGIQDQGPIAGAEIGYVPGSGEAYSAVTSSASAPNIPIYLEYMASVRGTVGLIFAAASPLDPNSPSTSGVPDAEFDHIVNSVVWT